MKKLIIVLIVICTSVNVNAAWTQRTTIKELRAQGNGMYVVLESFSNTDESINCDNDVFWLPIGVPDYQVRTSMLISAFATNQEIKISYYGCDNSKFEVGTISFVK